MPRRSASPRLGPPVGGKYLLRRCCRHGRHTTMVVELGYAIPGCVCAGCLVDQPALAMLNTAQAREIRRALEADSLRSAGTPPPRPAIELALASFCRADDLCGLVRRERRMTLQGTKAGLLTVCGCHQATIGNVQFGGTLLGQICTGCGHRLPSIQWLGG